MEKELPEMLSDGMDIIDSVNCCKTNIAYDEHFRPLAL